MFARGFSTSTSRRISWKRNDQGIIGLMHKRIIALAKGSEGVWLNHLNWFAFCAIVSYFVDKNNLKMEKKWVYSAPNPLVAFMIQHLTMTIIVYIGRARGGWIALVLIFFALSTKLVCNRIDKYKQKYTMIFDMVHQPPRFLLHGYASNVSTIFFSFPNTFRR